MASQDELDKAYMGCALSVAQLSKAKRAKVGAVIVSPASGIIAEGFNGTPNKLDNSCELPVCQHTSISYDEMDRYYKCGCGQELSLAQVADNFSATFNRRAESATKDYLVAYARNMMSNISYATPALLKTRPEVIHAESNAILKLATSTNSSVGATMYVTLMPCFDCAKQIIQTKIVRVVYKDDHSDTSGKRTEEGISLLVRAGIQVIQLK